MMLKINRLALFRATAHSRSFNSSSFKRPLIQVSKQPKETGKASLIFKSLLFTAGVGGLTHTISTVIEFELLQRKLTPQQKRQAGDKQSQFRQEVFGGLPLGEI